MNRLEDDAMRLWRRPMRSWKGKAVHIFIGRRLRERRVTLGMSQQELAGIIGVSYQQVQKYERGINRISAAQLYEVACALDTPITYFYEGFGETARPDSPKRRRLMEIARNFIEIQNQKHRELISEVVRLLAER